MKRLLALALTLGLAAACSGQTADRTPGPKDFAVALPLEAAPGAQVQRVDLPAAALVALKRPDRGDIRAFDANGRPLSTALLDARGATPQSTHLDAIPIAAQGSGFANSAVSVRVDRDGSAVTVDTSSSKAGADAAGVLFDTRKLVDPAQAITLDASLPMQRPVTMTVEASGDLKSWHVLAEQVLFRPGASPDLLGSGRIALPETSLEGQYLRVGWSGAPEAKISGATLYTAHSPLPPRIEVPTNGLVLADSHRLRFILPPGPTPAALRVTMTGKDGVVPIRLLGRNASDESWTLIAVASLRQGGGATLETGGSTVEEYSLEADARSAGFSQAPRLDLLFDPVALLVAFNGAAPYRLATGDAAAGPAFFAVSDLAATGPYPLAKVGGGNAGAAIDLTPASDSSFPALRTLALWTALILGTVVLVFAAYRLFRANTQEF